MGILRGVKAEELEPLAEAVLASGLETVELAMNTEGAAALIRRLRQCAGSKLIVGAGTVLTLETMHEALDAGATFIVLPVLVRKVVAHCVRNKIPVFPGALCPQEIYEASQAGAAMVKVFPARLFGPSYFRELRGPFRGLPLMACSGVTPENLPEYFESGADAVAIGSSVFQRDLLEKGDFSAIRRRLERYLSAWKTWREKPL
jgi:2-dehydro-3-deoxyphosphogluconate aldolase/(4S)-4-hydroxy-2-oxoglutarate aldolase